MGASEQFRLFPDGADERLDALGNGLVMTKPDNRLYPPHWLRFNANNSGLWLSGGAP